MRGMIIDSFPGELFSSRLGCCNSLSLQNTNQFRRELRIMLDDQKLGKTSHEATALFNSLSKDLQIEFLRFMRALIAENKAETTEMKED